jgi:hypothetical protein
MEQTVSQAQWVLRALRELRGCPERRVDQWDLLDLLDLRANKDRLGQQDLETIWSTLV